jgi:hypothetical protein
MLPGEALQENRKSTALFGIKTDWTIDRNSIA